MARRLHHADTQAQGPCPPGRRVVLCAGAQRAGMDPATFVQVLGVGGGWGAALDRLKPFLTDGDSSGLKFSIANAHKDLSYYNTMAEDTHADRTVAQAVLRTLAQAKEEGDPNAFLPEVVTRLVAR